MSRSDYFPSPPRISFIFNKITIGYSKVSNWAYLCGGGLIRSTVSWEGEDVELKTLRPGPGYNDPRAKQAREKILSNLDIRLEDVVSEPHDLERLRREILTDLVYLELMERVFPHVRQH